jgi:membrane protein
MRTTGALALRPDLLDHGRLMAVATTASHPPAKAAPSPLSRLATLLVGLALTKLVAAKRGPAQASPAPRGSAARRPVQSGARPGPAESKTARSHTGADAARKEFTEPDRGRAAEAPSEMPAMGWKDILWRVYAQVGEDRVLSVAAGVTFYALLAIFPGIAAFVSLYGLVSDATTINQHLTLLSGFLPGGALQIIEEQVRNITSKPGGALGFAFFSGLAISLWSANAGMKAMFDALNIVYDEDEKRSFFKLNLVSLTFTAGAILFLLLALTAVVVVPVILKLIPFGGIIQSVLSIARWPLLFVGLLFALACLYRYGPSRDKAEWRWVSWGSGIAAVVWLAGSMLFSWYVANFGNYNETYGSLGAAIGFMTWIWLSTTVILLGGEINAELEHQTAKDTTTGADRPLGARGAKMADSVGEAKA